MRRGRLPACCCRHYLVAAQKTERPHRLLHPGHPIDHHVTDRPHGPIADRDKPGRPARTTTALPTDRERLRR
jgi:hypothetical protein